MIEGDRSSTQKPLGAPIYDVHCHLHEYSLGDIEGLLEADRSLRIVAVSDDLESSLRTLELESMYPDRVIACVGLHPWSIGEEPLHRLEAIVEVAERSGVRCIGEVGLDARFVPQHTWSLQTRILGRFAELALELGAFMNLHAPDAWRETLSILVEYGVERAVFHWYTGPLDLIEVIGGRGYMISINPALRVQEKHARIAATAPLDYIVFESDAPYNYRGLKLNPLMIRETIEIVARTRGISTDDLIARARRNTEKLVGLAK